MTAFQHPQTHQQTSPHAPDFLARLPPGRLYRNLSTPRLIEQALRREEGWLSKDGAFIAHTGIHTGRSAQDKYVVQNNPSDGIWWDSPYQKPLSEQYFQTLLEDVLEHFNSRDTFVLDAFAGADRQFRLKVQVITEFAWHNHFARNMFIPCTPDEANESPHDFTVIAAPLFQADPARHGGRSQTQIVVSFEHRMVLIVGTSYAGEIKKSIFTVLNHLLPTQAVMPMHCSASLGAHGDVALFFGMSGTGKTTLSADPTRALIGDDEHGWTDSGVFNFEGGCYAKVIGLNQSAEPEIFLTTRTPGTLLENVVFDHETRELDLNDASLTENTRSAYPLSQISNAVIPSLGGHPQNIIFLTADAFGVLPPISSLTPDQAVYFFLNGYTAKIAGTEKGITEPQASFETAFGAPFLTRAPKVYAELLRQKIALHQTRVWLVNTGWTAGPYGVGHRIQIAHTRAMVRAALEGQLDGVTTAIHPIFGLQMPLEIEGVPSSVLNPQDSWTDKQAYDTQAKKLAQMFARNFVQYQSNVSEQISNVLPL